MNDEVHDEYAGQPEELIEVTMRALLSIKLLLEQPKWYVGYPNIVAILELLDTLEGVIQENFVVKEDLDKRVNIKLNPETKTILYKCFSYSTKLGVIGFTPEMRKIVQELNLTL